MPTRCTVCRRSDAGAINELLTEGRSARSVALEHGLSADTVQRHAARHLPRQTPRPDGRHVPTDPLDELVEALRPRALTGDPQVAHQYRLALLARDEARNVAPPVRALTEDPEWLALRALVLRVLEPYPEAVAALRDALGGQ